MPDPVADANALVPLICEIACPDRVTCDICKLTLLSDALSYLHNPEITYEQAVRKALKKHNQSLEGVNRKYDGREYYIEELPEVMRG
jgi:hypothetical protein